MVEDDGAPGGISVAADPVARLLGKHPATGEEVRGQECKKEWREACSPRRHAADPTALLEGIATGRFQGAGMQEETFRKDV